MELYDPRPKETKGKLCTTKKVLFGTLIFCAVMFVVIVIAWIVFDRTDATGLAGVVAAPAATAIGFYSWKAKSENLKKLEALGGAKITESEPNPIGFQSPDGETDAEG